MGSRVGLIDVDAESRGKVTFPNLALMKISAWHKAKGDTVEWYQPLISGHMDLVYMSRVFGDEYTKDYPWPVDADQVIRGGSGYAISVVDGEEVHNKAADPPLPYEIERMCPDYSIYDFPSTAYGFLTKGCPRGCPFCLVESMQGRRVVTVSHLSDWWHGEKHIVLLDPNITASRDWSEHMYALAMSEAKVDFSQGLDIRLMTPTKYTEINTVKWERIHFAWDNPADDLERDFAQAMRLLRGARKETVSAYVLTNAGSTHEQDLHRIMTLRKLGVQPYVMIKRKQTAPLVTRKLQRWVNSPMIFWKTDSFEEYQKEGRA